MSAKPILPFSHFLLSFRFEGANRLLAYAGSAWRGAFGSALKKSVCVVRDTACQACMLKESCAYPYIFETPPPDSEKMRLYTAAPHPFVINLKLDKQADPSEYRLGLMLFGRSYRYLPYIIHAFEKAGKHGLGPQNQVFELVRVDQITPDQKERTIYQGKKLEQPSLPATADIPECPDEIDIHLLTPLRIKQEGKNCNEQRLNFSAFFGSLLRRHSMLTYFHTDTPLETDFSQLMQQAKEIPISQQDLSWRDWTRYSSRQQTKMNMGGLIGTFTLKGDLKPFWPYLWLGQWTHTGKGTSMGLGAYRIHAASLPSLPD
ncbi:MAG: CRISPR system precrRNA processing endoribonuclease RAMP protein Cas6 [Gammaproteobacteria bacterium]